MAKKPRISTSVPQDVKKDVEEVAEKKQLSESETASRALEIGIKQMKKELEDENK